MKIIDLLNKIANGEDLPKKIKIRNKIYTKHEEDYVCDDEIGYWDSLCLLGDDLDFASLNEEVEIIEEDKKIEKLYGILNPKEGTTKVPNNEELMFKINEIIDKLNEGDK